MTILSKQSLWTGTATDSMRHAKQGTEYYVRINPELQERRKFLTIALVFVILLLALALYIIFTDHAWYWHLTLVPIAIALRWFVMKLIKYTKLVFFV